MRTHGLSKHELYPIWLAMKDRCNNPNHISYKNYGAKGVQVCQRWADSFPAFLADVGERPSGGMIDRIDSNGDYEPSNFRWATRYEQNQNRGYCRKVTFRGQTMTLKEWSREVGIRYSTLIKRHKYNWSVERMLTLKPVVGRNQTEAV